MSFSCRCRIIKNSGNWWKYFSVSFIPVCVWNDLQTNQKDNVLLYRYIFPNREQFLSGKAQGKKSCKLKLSLLFQRKQLLIPEVLSAWEWTMRLIQWLLLHFCFCCKSLPMRVPDLDKFKEINFSCWVSVKCKENSK